MSSSNPLQQKRLPRWLVFLSNLTLAYPLLLPVSVYCHWLLSWAVLGHQPIHVVDDPKFIDATDWTWIISALAFLGIIPMACIGVGLNALYIVKAHLTATQTRHRILLFLALWLGTWLLVGVDPGSIFSWWFD